MAVVEMGANHQGEIAELARICEPDMGYITNFGKAHLEGFGGVEGVIKGKSELYTYLNSRNDTYYLVNADDPIQLEKTRGVLNVVTFGQGEAHYPWHSTSDGPMAAIAMSLPAQELLEIHSQLSGSFQETNIAAAAALGLHWKVPAAAIKAAIEGYQPKMNRSEWRVTDYNTVLLDAYNANPTSMALSISNFIKWHPQGVLVLGDMFELGQDSAAEHQAIVDLLVHQAFEGEVFLVGAHFGRTRSNFVCVDTAADLLDYWNKKGAPKGAHLLLKGSRGIALEQVLPAL